VILTKSEIYKCSCALLKRPKRNVETFFQNRSQQLKSTNEIYNNDIGSYKHVKTLDTRFTYPVGMEGWVDLGDSITPQLWIEPSIEWLCATKTPHCSTSPTKLAEDGNKLGPYSRQTNVEWYTQRYIALNPGRNKHGISHANPSVNPTRLCDGLNDRQTTHIYWCTQCQFVCLKI